MQKWLLTSILTGYSMVESFNVTLNFWKSGMVCKRCKLIRLYLHMQHLNRYQNSSFITKMFFHYGFILCYLRRSSSFRTWVWLIFMLKRINNHKHWKFHWPFKTPVGDDLQYEDFLLQGGCWTRWPIRSFQLYLMLILWKAEKNTVLSGIIY